MEKDEKTIREEKCEKEYYLAIKNGIIKAPRSFQLLLNEIKEWRKRNREKKLLMEAKTESKTESKTERETKDKRESFRDELIKSAEMGEKMPKHLKKDDNSFHHIRRQDSKEQGE